MVPVARFTSDWPLPFLTRNFVLRKSEVLPAAWKESQLARFKSGMQKSESLLRLANQCIISYGASYEQWDLPQFLENRRAYEEQEAALERKAVLDRKTVFDEAEEALGRD
ncbi:hypothetical protein RRF57_011816 [Xylaria bambusicola]|uniref:Uncharacterized protein n=1 Tax=Xylaria bambusicola TaxID=326684 RepID=A0AAN7UNG9_9PEZI